MHWVFCVVTQDFDHFDCMRSSYNCPGPKSVCSRPAAFFLVLGLVRSCGLAENLDAIWMGLHCSGEGWESCTTPPGSVFLVFFFLVFNCTVGEPQDVLRIVNMHSLPFPNLVRLLFFFFFPFRGRQWNSLNKGLSKNINVTQINPGTNLTWSVFTYLNWAKN